MRYKYMDKIAYRADTRGPEIIFKDGFWNKENPDYRWEQIALGNIAATTFEIKDDIKRKMDQKYFSRQDFNDNMTDFKSPRIVQPPTQDAKQVKVRLSHDRSKFYTVTMNKRGGVVLKSLWEHYANNKALLRARGDIKPSTAVCLTLRPDVAPLFPVLEKRTAGEWVWVYAVRLNAAIPTYEIQKRNEPSLVFAQEVAVEHVPVTHILCAIRCWREGVLKHVTFNYSPRIVWNPNVLPYERMRSRVSIERALQPFQGYQTRCPDGKSPTIRLARKVKFEPLQ